MLHTLIMVMGQVVNHFVGSARMTCKDNMFISFFACPGQVSIDIFIRIGETFIPGADGLFLTGINIYSFNLSKCVIGLGIDEINVSAVTRKMLRIFLVEQTRKMLRIFLVENIKNVAFFIFSYYN